MLDGQPGCGQAQLAQVGFVAQDTPVFAGLSVADHLRFGAHLNPGWDAAYAENRGSRGSAWIPASGRASCPGDSEPSSP